MTDYNGSSFPFVPFAGPRAQSAAGSISLTTVYELPDPPPEPDPPDTTPPLITNVDPPQGGEIRRFQPVRFTVTDDRGIVAAFINDGDGYTVYNGNTFFPRYAQSSVRLVQNDGRIVSMTFEIRKQIGWGVRPRLSLLMTDGAGNKAVLSV